MPERNRIILKLLLPVGLVVALVALARRESDEWEYGHDSADESQPPASPPVRARRRPAARFALAGAMTTLFFAGASFTAGAGDQLAKLVEEDGVALEAYQAETPPAEPMVAEAPGEEPAAELPTEAAPGPALEPATEVAPEAAAEAIPEAAPAPDVAPEVASEPAPEPSEEAAVAEAVVAGQPLEGDAVPAAEPEAAPAPSSLQAATPAAAPAVRAPKTAPAPAKPVVRSQPTTQWVVKRAAATPPRAPEIEEGYGEPTIWLNRALPDPTPASARLARPFARELRATSNRNGADWALVLGVLRAQGERGSVPATKAELETLASRLDGPDAWKAALAVSGRTAFADRATALADLYRSVGLEALVTGLVAAKERLAERLLEREGVLVYSGGRSDIETGRIDVRVLVLIGYLAERHGSVTVSSLFTGHRKFARPGVISAHTYGQAVDIAAVGGTPIAGNQQPGGLTEEAVRSVLLLPAELQPQQVISLLGLGGPSFPLRDHGDHIHIGF